MKKYRENPDAGKESSSDSSSSDSDSGSGSGSGSGSDSDSDEDEKKTKSKKEDSGSDSGSGSDSDKWDSDTLSSDDESEDEADSGLTGRARWVKKVVSKEKLEAMKLKEEGKRHNGTTAQQEKKWPPYFCLPLLLGRFSHVCLLFLFPPSFYCCSPSQPRQKKGKPKKYHVWKQPKLEKRKHWSLKKL